MKDPKKWPGLAVPLPGLKAPSAAKGPPMPEEVIVTIPAQPPQAAGQEQAVKFHAQTSRRVVSVSQTEQHEQVSINYERGPAMHAASPQHDEMPPSVTPVYVDPPQQESEPYFAPSEHRSPLASVPTLGFAAVGAVVLIVSLLILQQPLSNWSQAQSYAKQQAMIEAQQRAEYQALDADVRGIVCQVQKNLVNLDIQAQDLAADAELRVGQPIQRLQTNPRERPRELDLAILESKDTAANWASLTNAVCRPREANPVYLDVQQVNNRIRDGKLVPADHALAVGLLTSTTHQETQAVKRYGQVRRLTESLEARRFELLLDSTEGSK